MLTCPQVPAPNLGLLRTVCAHPDRPVIAGGGVANGGNRRGIVPLRRGCGASAIAGKALCAGLFTPAGAPTVAR